MNFEEKVEAGVENGSIFLYVNYCKKDVVKLNMNPNNANGISFVGYI